MNNEFETNEFNKHNIDLFSKLFLRIKPVQGVVKEMTEKVEMILRKELINNREQLKAFINLNPPSKVFYPHTLGEK